MLNLGIGIKQTLGGGSGGIQLKSLVPSTVAEWDATQFSSYSGTGQIWNNLTGDGAYNLALGTSTTPSTDDPTFVGTAGSPSAYWTNDGGDRFTLNGSNTTFLNALHKTTGGTSFWIAVAMRVGDAATSVNLIGTNTSASALGMRINQASTESLALFQGDGTISKNISTSSPAQTIGSDIVAIYSYNGTTARRWINSNTKTETAGTLNTATADAANPLTLFLNAPIDMRFYAAAIGNTFIDDAEATLIAQTYFNRHQRGYGLFPENTVAPAISGTQIVGSVLTTTNGTWLNSPTFTYQWRRNGVPIASATASTYTLVTADLGAAITCAVTGTANGQSRAAISNTLNIANNLSAVVSSAVFQHDATFAASYDGSSQTWANLITSPADGSAQTAYDMVLGTTSSPATNDPTFVGSAGSAAAYWSFDGGDRFTLSGSNTTFLNALHKTTGGTSFWLLTALRVGDSTTSTLVLGTNSSGSSLLGIRLNQASADTASVFQGDGTSSKNIGTSVPMTVGADTLVLTSYDGANLRQWVNTRSKVTTASTLNTATLDANNQLSAFLNYPADGRGYAIAGGNTYIDDAEAARIFDAYNLWHGRTYA